MEKPTYTVITFAPVQGFIEKSRKLRDLYGSSYLLSLLSWAICRRAQTQGCSVVSPALPSITQGMPNQIILKGKLSEDGVKQIKSTFYLTWRIITNTCRKWIEENLNQWEYAWGRNWDLWGRHAWEFFSAQGQPGDTITEVRQLINQAKSSRNWTGINWQGESSTLSGADAIAYPELGLMIDPRQYNYQQEQQNITRFYQELSRKLGEVLVRENYQSSANNLAEEKEDNSQLSESEEEKKKQELIQQYGSTFINDREQLSIPELTKRLITHKTILENFQDELKLQENREVFGELPLNINLIAKELNPKTFKDLNRHKEEQEESKYWTGWFQGDGDGAGKYFQSLKEQEEEKLTNKFSEEMRDWGNKLMKQQREKLPGKSRMIYAGGDDFLGILYEENKQIQPLDCLRWFYTFKSDIWHWPEEKKITPSVGFVWAGSQVPQRDILQHCDKAEKSAKEKGRDRIAFRVLFNSGNYLEWVCPWWVLDVSDLEKLSKNSSDTKIPKEAKIEASVNLIESYQDRNNEKNWTHFYQDVALLESRHAFDSKKIIDIALGLIEIYFSQEWYEIIANPKNWFNRYDKNQLQTFTGILGDAKSFSLNYKDNLVNQLIVSGNSLQVVAFIISLLIQNSFDKFASLFLEDYPTCLMWKPNVKQAFNNWVINLAKVGFRLTEDKKS